MELQVTISPESLAPFKKLLEDYSEALVFIHNLKNDDGSIPVEIWNWRTAILKKAKERVNDEKC